ncbi:MAG: 2-oxoacid:ferredoxin oxidoreductase subunit beta [Deltaproteobacteria bacterium]|jgi:2-oxoglutarate ferredoxin oxidoreductase subunit beta|nr:MAG: 2-oxoacid:ferredoxin oxidoreductase subunit beta [Deltaproteobacteria bacterium]
MVTISDYGKYDTTWCPGCGNFSILEAMKQALVARGLEPHQVLFISGIGQAAKAPHYLNANVFNGLHGRSLPVATGAKLANPELTVIVESGDGCSYGEGGNHFLAAIRRNIDVTLLAHNNQVYGLTKGQASPTSDEGFITKVQPGGVASAAFNPAVVAVAMHAGFVARAFARLTDNLSDIIQQAIAYRGFSLIDVLQPCVSFNKVNTFAWYKSRCYPLPKDYDPTDWYAAVKTADQWGDRIPVGVIYRNERPPFEEHFPVLSQGPLVGRDVDRMMLKKIMEGYA